MRLALLVALLAAASAAALHAPPGFSADPADYAWFSACPSPNGSLSVVPGLRPDCPARGFHNDSTEAAGWAFVAVVSNTSFPLAEQAEAAGFVEGALTARRARQMRDNVWPTVFPPRGDGPSAAVAAWVKRNLAYVSSQVAANAGDAYWEAVGAVLAQVRGLAAGTGGAVSEADALLLNAWGDLGDVEAHLDGAPARVQTHCSALFKAAGDDMFLGHTTWSTFTSALRQFKYYDVGGAPVLFSGYPGVVDSNDDFYVLPDSGLVVVETTNEVINASAYGSLPAAGVVPTFVRAVVANRLATTGDGWAATFLRHNSGTYNNDWLVMDTKLARSPALPLAPGTLTMAAQMPGASRVLDLSAVASNATYFASYNRPYVAEFYERMGYAAYRERYGAYLFGAGTDYFRGAILAREQAGAADAAGVAAALSFNEWQTDPLSRGEAGWSVSARFDLQPSTPAGVPAGWFEPGAHGGIDTKVVSASSVRAGAVGGVLARSGPTTSHGQPPFEWSGRWEALPHEGMPSRFDFGYVEYGVPPPPGTSEG